MELDDIYAKLRPPAPTPLNDLCQRRDTPLKLMSALGFNPIHCMDCNREVAPETLPLSLAAVDAIASWRSIYDAVDRLWLDSGPYEEWARRELSDIGSPVNSRGRAVQGDLDRRRRCYYWYFQDESMEDYQPLRACPVCGEMLQDYTHGIFLQRVCERDSIVVSGD